MSLAVRFCRGALIFDDQASSLNYGYVFPVTKDLQTLFYFVKSSMFANLAVRKHDLAKFAVRFFLNTGE